MTSPPRRGRQLVGRLVDRFGRRRVLGPEAMLQALMLVAIVIATHAGAGAVVLVVLSALAGGLWPPIAPSVRALLRDLVRDAKVRETAYALESVIQELVWISGPLVVAGVIAFASPAAAVLLSGAVSVSGTLLFVSSPAALGRGSRAPRTGRSPVLAIPELRAMLGPIFLNGLAIGAVGVGIPALALHAGSRPASGLLLAVWSAGSIIGGLWYGSREWHAPLSARYRALLWTGVICMAPLIAARTIPEGLAGAVLAGLVLAPGVLVSVRAGRPGRHLRGRDRGVHLGVIGAGGWARRRIGARRGRGLSRRGERAVRARGHGDGAGRGVGAADARRGPAAGDLTLCEGTPARC